MRAEARFLGAEATLDTDDAAQQGRRQNTKEKRKFHHAIMQFFGYKGSNYSVLPH